MSRKHMKVIELHVCGLVSLTGVLQHVLPHNL